MRWFTPTTEVDLCGHATLAAAKIIYETTNYSRDHILFHTKSGDLSVKRSHDGFKNSKSTDSRFDFISRFFGPDVGINEDPVTDSAHCYLAPYWSDKLNKAVLNAYQALPRGGEIECELVGNNVLLRGSAVIMSELIVQWSV